MADPTAKKKIRVENRTSGTIVLDVSATEAIVLKPGFNDVDGSVWRKAQALPAASKLAKGDAPALYASQPVA